MKKWPIGPIKKHQKSNNMPHDKHVIHMSLN